MKPNQPYFAMSFTQKKTALVLGATGLVGSQVLQLLLEDDRYEKVLVFHRRKTGVTHPKLTEYVIKFDEINIWKHLIAGDHLFSALGTTIKQAGSQNAQYKVDYDHQYDFARVARKNGITHYCLISSIGASSKSKNFYTHMKGRLDKDVKKLKFEKTLILRPSFLKGNRQEKRILEKMGIQLFSIISFLPGIQKYKPIKGKQLAEAMINGLNDPSTKRTHTGDEIFKLISS